MKSHKIVAAATTFPVSVKEQIRFKKIIVCGAPAAFATMVVTGAHSYTAIFNATVGCYSGPFEFAPGDQIVITPEANTVVLLEGFTASF